MRGHRSRVNRAAAKGIVVALIAALSLVALPPASVTAATESIKGRVESPAAPLEVFEVTLYATNGPDRAATELASTMTDPAGLFELDFETPTADGSVLYVIAERALPTPHGRAVVFASVLGEIPIPPEIVVNERTTVATGFAMAQFTTGTNISGGSPGLQNAVGMAHNLVNPRTGHEASVLALPPNGPETSTVETFNSLANMLAACVAAEPACVALFDAASPPDGPATADTFQTIVDIAHNPWQHPLELFAVSLLGPTPYGPARAVPPDAWTLALRFVGDGNSMSGPGNFVIDHEGNVWATTNYQYSPDPFTPVCGSEIVVKFTPNGQYAAGSPYRGGGLSGAGFGITIDPYGDVWVGNFGFAAPAPGCPDELQPPHNSISQFLPDGTPVSPATGYTQGGISWPQATISDTEGNIWIANCGNDSVTIFPDGDPTTARQLTDVGIGKPFDIDHNTSGQAFVTGVGSNSVALLDPDGTPAANSPITGGGLAAPLGIATDRYGNAWVANSALVDIPCPDLVNTDSFGGSITLINPDGTLGSPTAFTGGGLTIPWGLEVDGNNNVWVANFAGKRLSQFCGVDSSDCPPGVEPGGAISPDAGYSFDGLVRNTGVDIDQSGNVWVANNWKEVPVQTNPGGYEVVVFIGLGGPVDRAAPKPKPGPGLPNTGAETRAAVVPRFTG